MGRPSPPILTMLKGCSIRAALSPRAAEHPFLGHWAWVRFSIGWVQRARFPRPLHPLILSCPSIPAGWSSAYPHAGAPATLSGGLLDYNNDVANAVYHGLTLTAVERIGKLFNLTANYTYSHTIDNGNFTTFINLPPNQFDYASERGNSNQDVRHHLVTNFTAMRPRA